MNLSQELRAYAALMESENFESGVYCSAKPSQSTIDAIRSFQAAYDIPNPTPASELHATIIYSEKGNPEFTSQDKYDSEIKAKFAGWDLFGENKDTLVMKVESDELQKRHKDLMSQYDLSYNFDTYRPHITLSYDAGDIDIDSLDDYHGDIMFTGESSNELDTDWEPDDDEDSDT